MTDVPSDIVLDRVDEGYVLLDGDDVVAYNPAARSLLGIDADAATPTIASLPGPVQDYLEEVDAAATERADGEGSSTRELEVPGTDGPRHLEVEVASIDAGSFGGRLLLVRDVSDRVQQDRYRGILEGSGDAVYALDPDGRYTYTNRANTRLLGYGRSEMIGMHVSEIMDDGDVERIEAVIGELLEEGGSGRVVVEHDVIASDGDRIPVENHVSLLVDDDGEFRGTAGVVRDVTERRERQEQLERYERIVETMGDGVYAMDADGRYTLANEQMLELNGYDREDVLGSGPDLVHDEEDIERFEAAIRELVAEDRPGVRTVEATLETAGGEEVPIEVNHTILTGDDGEFRGTVGVVRDVTDRKERERELEQYETIVETVPEGVAVIDEDGTVVSANETAASLFGYEHDAFVGGSLDRLVEDGVVAEHDVEAYVDTVRELRSSDASDARFDFEARVGGDRRVFETQIAPRPHEGEFHGVVATLQDVTERKERERELEQYETLLEVMPDTVVVTDDEGRIVDLHGFEGWTGYDRDELIGADVSLTTTEESIEKAEAMFAELLRDDDLEKVTYETDVVTGDGERVPHENNLALLPPDEDGTIPGSMSVLRDVSDRKERERALEELNETTRELVTAESREVIVEKTVETASEVLDLPLAGVWLYDGKAEALSPASYPDDDALPVEPPVFRPGESLAWEAFESGEPCFYDDLAEAETVHNSETSIRSEIAVPLGDHGVLVTGSTDPEALDEDQLNLAGILGAAVGTAFDRLDRERERAEQRRALRRKNERLEEFASVVSHDLRNPLNVAQARVQMSRQSGDLDQLESADDALDRANALVDDLLALAREGSAAGETEPVNLETLATEAWEHVETPDASLAVDADVTIEADRGRLRGLFENLIRNAVEHAGPDVAVRVGTVEGEGGGEDAPPAAFYVEDDGPGIPPEEREAVLERGVTGSDDGTGYGLAIVDDIAGAHGWSVDVTGGSAGGARFEFTLARPEDPGSPAR